MRGRIFGSMVVALALWGGAPAVAVAQDQTLADIRQELTVLYVDVQRLKRELSTTGGVQAMPTAGSTMERVDQIEAEMQRLTAKTEELQNRINQVVSDGTNRIGDLEFRLVELEGGDTSKLGETTTLGGGASPGVATPPSVGSQASDLAVGEQGDFDRAKKALDDKDYQGAATLFAAFSQTYTAGGLTGEAHYYRGEALTGLGQTTAAARAYLESYSGFPQNPRASDALFKLGATLAKLGQMKEACVTLGQVPVVYPGTAAASEATITYQNLSCG